MDRHRFATVLDPQPPAEVIKPAGFLLCPVGCFPGMIGGPWCAAQQLYRWAFEQAQAVCRPSIVEYERTFSRN